MLTKEEKAEIWLDSFQLDYEKKVQIYKLAPSPYELVKNFEKYRAAVDKIAEEKAAVRMEESLMSADYMLSLLQTYADKNIFCVSYSSSLYPNELKEIPTPPLVLYCKGNLELLAKRKFAIVGSRHTLPSVMKIAERFSRDLSKYFTIVTGLADGGDTAAIRGALESGNLISVLAYGFDHVYPECNRGLLEEIEKRGLVITEYLPQEKPRGYMFPVRNRILAGLAEGVLVVSGGEKSGTRITAERAYEYGRDVFAFPYSVGVESGKGCNAILKEYAKLTDDLVDITSAFGINLTETEEITMTEAERKVFEIVREGEVHISQIAQKSGLKAYELPPVLTMLEMKNLIVSCGGNRYTAIR